MKDYKLGEKPFKCPDCWRDITIEQMLKINTGIERSIETVVICTGISEEEWNASNDFKLIEEVKQTLAFISSPEGLDYTKIPDEFVFKDVVIPKISDIGNHSIAQYQDLEDEILKFEKDEGPEINEIRRFSLYPKIVAIYLQPYITGGSYDWIKAESIGQDLYKHSAMEVCALGSFFIRRFYAFRGGIVKDAQTLNTTLKSQRPAFLSYLKSLALKLYSIASQAATFKRKTTF